MAGMKKGDAVLLTECGQMGEVLCADIAGHVLLQLPQLDAVVLVREDSVSRLDARDKDELDRAMLEQQREASRYLQQLLRAPAESACM